MSAVWSSDEPAPPADDIDPRLPRALAIVTTLAGGLLMAIGGAGSWARIGEGNDAGFFFPFASLASSGYGWEGTIVIVLGVATMAFGVLMLMTDLSVLTRGIPVLVGITGIALVLYHQATVGDLLIELASDFDLGTVDIRIGYPAVVTLVGSGFATIGGVFAVLAARQNVVVEPGDAGQPAA